MRWFRIIFDEGSNIIGQNKGKEEETSALMFYVFCK